MALVKLFKDIFSSKKAKKKKSPPKTKNKPIAGSRKKVKKKTLAKPAKKLEKSKEEEIGVVTHYFGKIKVGIIKLKAGLKVGDKIHVKGAHDDFTQGIKSMQYDHKDISLAKKGLEVGIKVSRPVHENDKVYKV